MRILALVRAPNDVRRCLKALGETIEAPERAPARRPNVVGHSLQRSAGKRARPVSSSLAAFGTGTVFAATLALGVGAAAFCTATLVVVTVAGVAGGCSS